MSQCTATAKSSGKRCAKDAMHGGTVCDRHGGLAPQVRAKAEVRAELSRWVEGDSVDDPAETILRLITQSRRRADVYAAMIDDKVAVAHAEYGEAFTLERILIGDTMTVLGDAAIKTGEYIRGLIQLEAAERDRLGVFTSKALAAGIAQRQLRMAERTGAQIADLLDRVATDPELALTLDQLRALPQVLRRHLDDLKSGGAE